MEKCIKKPFKIFVFIFHTYLHLHTPESTVATREKREHLPPPVRKIPSSGQDKTNVDGTKMGMVQPRNTVAATGSQVIHSRVTKMASQGKQSSSSHCLLRVAIQPTLSVSTLC